MALARSVAGRDKVHQAVVKITSLQNERVRRVLALRRSTRQRLREGLFIAEGLRLVQELAQSGLPVAQCFWTAEFAAESEGRALIAALESVCPAQFEVSPEVMATLSDTETPQGILAVLPLPALPPRAGDLCLIPDRVRDPGNLGTLLRTAWATGVTQVWLPPGTVEFTNPKVVRAGMGAHFHIPLTQATWADIQRAVAGSRVWLAEAGEGTPYDAVDWRGATTLIVGGEAEGAGPEARALAGQQGRVYIPMAPGVDSLNAAMAATVLLFEAARQRRDAR